MIDLSKARWGTIRVDEGAITYIYRMEYPVIRWQKVGWVAQGDHYSVSGYFN